MAGIRLGEIPALRDILRNIRTIQSSPSEPSLGQNLPPLTQLLSSAGLQGESAAPKAQSGQGLYPVGQGLPPVQRRLTEMILKGEYVDFTEFPPEKCKVKSLPNFRGQHSGHSGSRSCSIAHIVGAFFRITTKC